jgi:hypothetical protein
VTREIVERIVQRDLNPEAENNCRQVSSMVPQGAVHLVLFAAFVLIVLQRQEPEF